MKRLVLLCAFLSISVLSGCTNSGHTNSRNNIFNSLFSSSQKSTNSVSSLKSSSEESSSNIEKPIYDKIDIDLTKMNATMVYSQVYEMLDEPSKYINKIVKVKGPFRPYESSSPDYCYPAILIMDATACCGNGLEFLLYGVKRCSLEGGNGYPLYNEEATIVGRFETYLEDTYLYVHLVDSIWLKNE